MQASQTPTLVPLAFAANGTKNAIPEASQIGVTPGAASLNDGFPPLTFTPVAAGGVPPAGADFNGVLNLITQSVRWAHGGGRYPFNSTFAADANVSGYPAGAELMSADLQGAWLSLNDANTDNPDTGPGTKWVPSRAYGVTSVTGLTNANVTLTPAQAAKNRITLAGTLTGNVQIIFPTWLREWTIVNNTTGAFTVTAKTAAGSGVAIPQNGSPTKVVGDGTNITQLAENIAAATQNQHPAQFQQVNPGRLLNVQVFTASGTYTPTSGTNKVRVTLVGGGGAGGGASATSSGQVSAGAGGSSGADTVALLTTGFSGVTVTIGAGGVGNAGGTGNTGGTSSFGSILTAPGGPGGNAVSAPTTQSNIASPGNQASAATATAGLISASRGGQGTVGYCILTTVLSGTGGASRIGGGGGAVGNGSGNSTLIAGAGGGGAAAIPSIGAAATGGTGGSGICIVEEFS